MSWNYCPRVKFSPTLWERWQAQRETDVQTLKLREGIQEFRRALEERYVPDVFPLAARK